MNKNIVVKSIPQYSPPQWYLGVEDGLGISMSVFMLDRERVARLVSELNAAAEAGAPWKKLEEVK